tara:strand:- start:2101 stop:2331 length:231 start_codon:yes stop_codon:yes gene_type:complete
MKYVIINSNEVGTIDFSQIEETSATTLRYNKDGSKTFVKFKGDTPSFLKDKDQYTNSQMLSLLQDSTGDWYENEEG